MAIARNGTVATLAGRHGANPASSAAYPAGIVAGELLLLGMFTVKGLSTSYPAGWVLIGKLESQGGFQPAAYAFYRWAVGSETGNVVFNASDGSGANAYASVMARYSGVNATTPIDAAAVTNNQTLGTSIVASSVTTTVDGCVALRAVGLDTDTAITEDAACPSIGEIGSGATSPFARCTLAEEVRATAGATGTRTFTFALAGGAAVSFALRPAAGGTDATATPVKVSAVAAVGAPTTTTVTSATATPVKVSAVAAVATPTVSTGQTATPGTVAAVAGIATPATTASSNVTATPATVVAATAIPVPAVSTGQTATPGTVAAAASVGAPILPVSVTTLPATLELLAAIGIPTVSTGVTVTPGTVGGGQGELIGGVGLSGGRLVHRTRVLEHAL